MPVKIKRKADWNGGGPLKVKLDGKETDSIKYFENIDVELPKEQAELSVSQWVATSNKVIVSDGETVHITVRYLNVILLSLFLFAMIIAPELFSVEGLGIRLLIMLPFIPLILLLGSINWYRLEVVGNEPAKEAEGN